MERETNKKILINYFIYFYLSSKFSHLCVFGKKIKSKWLKEREEQKDDRV